MTSYLVGLIGSLLVLAGIFELLRRRQLSEKYAVLWLVVGVLLLVLTVFPRLLGTLSRAVGFAVPSNLLFFVGIVFLVGVCLHLSWELSRLENETRKLAEDIALLRLDLRELRNDDPRKREAHQLRQHDPIGTDPIGTEPERAEPKRSENAARPAQD